MSCLLRHYTAKHCSDQTLEDALTRAMKGRKQSIVLRLLSTRWKVLDSLVFKSFQLAKLPRVIEAATRLEAHVLKKSTWKILYLLSCENGFTRAALALVKHQSVGWSICYQGLFETIKRGQTESFYALINQGGLDPSELDCEALVVAAKYNQSEIVKFLLVDKRVDSNAQGGKTLQIAIEQQNVEIVKLLVNSVEFCRSFMMACKSGNLDIVKLFLDKIDIQNNQETCINAGLLVAIQDHLDNIAEYLLPFASQDINNQNIIHDWKKKRFHE